MTHARLVLCNGATGNTLDPTIQARKRLELNAYGAEANVTLNLEDISAATLARPSPRVMDLLDLAAYIFTCDCAVGRGTGFVEGHSREAWEREFHFAVAVRDFAFWDDPVVKQALTRTLAFISDDSYEFSFEPILISTGGQEQFDFAGEPEPLAEGVHYVTMFSGGLDSLAGVLELLQQGEKTVLVSHRATPAIYSRQRELKNALDRKYGKDLIHVPVAVFKETGMDDESTQRTRSFLFSALGAAVADLFNVSEVRFYENGVVSLNLPVADEVIRARASRTTHPLGFQYMETFIALVLERPFKLSNPFIFNTKTEVLERIKAAGGVDFIPMTVSCATPGRKATKSSRHCGKCSQCIDRRIAVLATGMERHDPETDYMTDVLYGPRPEGYATNMAVNYARHAVELHDLTDDGIGAKFSKELGRASRPFPVKREAAERFIAMHKRHAAAVYGVLERELAACGGTVLSGELEPTSMLGLLMAGRHRQTIWRGLAEKIGSVLALGIPVACKTHKPKDEPALQEIADGILMSNKLDLRREFPFMPWSASTTKPDWSAETQGLWVELKYVRKKSDVRVITEDISSDITKYGDNDRHVLFVVYDPARHIVNDKGFGKEIERRPTMMLQMIR